MAKIIEINDVEQIDKNDKNLVSALSIVCEFWDVSACAIIKDAKPVGVALAPSCFEAKIKALDCNPIEAIGADIAFSKKIDKDTIKSLAKMGFKRLIVPKLDNDVKAYLKGKDIEAIEITMGLIPYKKSLEENSDLTPKSFKVATKLKPDQEQIEDMVFAWKVLKSIKEDSIIVAKDFKTRAIIFGTKLNDIEMAMDNACDGSKEAILAISKNISDTTILNPAIQGRIKAIIEPKSDNNSDKEILKLADKYEITVVTTGNQEE